MRLEGDIRILEVGAKYPGESIGIEQLRTRGFRIDCAGDGSAALEAAASHRHRVTLVHYSARGGVSGLDVGRALRKVRPDLGIVVLGPGWDRVARRQVIEEFADACLTEDTDVADLAALLIALDRRATGAASAFGCLRWHSLQLDFLGSLVIADGHEIMLQPLQVRILGCLIQHSGTVVTCEQLRRQVFRSARLGNTSIPRQISVLRRLLGRLGAEIKTAENGYGLGIP